MIKELSIQTEQQVELLEVTAQVQKVVDQSGIREGLVLLFVPHTTAAVTINENADPDVATDLVQGLNKLIPLQDNYLHMEGNSAAHIKSSLIGVSEQLILHNRKLQLGTWQGLYFCEFDGPRTRRLRVKIVPG